MYFFIVSPLVFKEFHVIGALSTTSNGNPSVIPTSFKARDKFTRETWCLLSKLVISYKCMGFFGFF